MRAQLGELDDLFTPGSGYLLPSFVEGLDALSEAVAGAARRRADWLGKVGVGLRAALGFLDDEPQWTGLLVLEAPVGGATTVACTQRVHAALLPVLEEARHEVIVGAQTEPSTWLIAELVTLAVLSVVRRRLLRAEGQPLADLTRSLMDHVIEPYLAKGAERADERRDGRARPRAERMEMVPLRPHPRTMQALRTIAAAPQLSTREVGRAVGVDNNSGHITALLRRLEERGLIENASARKTARERSTWFLTPYGQRVLEVVSKTYRQARDQDDALGQLEAGVHNSLLATARGGRDGASTGERA